MAIRIMVSMLVVVGVLRGQTISSTPTKEYIYANGKLIAVESIAQANLVVMVAPANISLGPSVSRQFSATVTGTTNQTVTWSIAPPSLGTINPNTGLYTAPQSILSQQSVMVKATSAVDNSAFGTSLITLVPISSSQGLRFVPVTPCRIIDTRLAPGPFGGPAIVGGSVRSIAIPASSCAIPGNAAAYSLNVTVVPAGTLGFLTLWPTGQPQPIVSTLNASDGRVKANAALVAAGASGSVSVYVTNTTNVVLDINGYFVPPIGASNLAFYPVTPCRVADTRNPPGPLGGPSMAAAQTRSFSIAGASCGIPATAQAYSLNMTVVPGGALAFLTTWPAGQSQPLVSTLNAPTGAVTANAAIVPAGANGAINVYVTNPTDIIIDTNGYFAPPGNSGELLLYTVNPCRISDTRNAVAPLGGPTMSAGQSRNFPIPTSNCGLPSSANAYSLNATVVPRGALGFLALWPSGQAQPLVSTLNSSDGSIISNAAIVPAGSIGSVNTYVTNVTDLILDVNGYFAP
jgi:hypothetical protein